MNGEKKKSALDRSIACIISADREVRVSSCTKEDGETSYNMIEFKATPRELLCQISGTEVIEQYLSENGCVNNETKSPTLDDYTTIKSYEDACNALGVNPVLNDIAGTLYDGNDDEKPLYEVPKHIIALMKLETISRALWGRDFEPKPDAEGSECYWCAWHALWTESEIKEMSEEKRGALLSAYALNGASAGFGYLDVYNRSSIATARIGFRLCQETEEKAEYFGQQFVELWAEYLAYNFTVGERLK